ncbi:hypothetical protein ZHAS_00007566 [Anopheles sinensis]|uniref:Uncharacterized protein n=1 Tax=Anopheles sinensis TaxID=74873 RepID=A0A084VQE9_ANOSI|nr:hypothetical protein ZHAS_00007566 [Anopheles sinensis]
MLAAGRKRYPMDIPFERTRFRKLATATLLLCASFGVLRAEELRCERIMLGACQNLVYDMTIASAPETALDYLAHSGPSPATAGNGGNGSASGIVRTWLDAERLVSVVAITLPVSVVVNRMFPFTINRSHPEQSNAG